jgi:hypothetical protein
MSEETGFTTMAGPKAEGEAPEIGFGMLGYAFMGKAHSNALKTLPYMMRCGIRSCCALWVPEILY